MKISRLAYFGIVSLALLAAPALLLCAQPAAPGNALVQRALANEIRFADDEQHPMRYRLHKASPRYATTKDVVETRDGAVSRLIAVNNAPLSAEDEQKEQGRLSDLLRDPSRQHRRKQSEQNDTARVLKVLRVLPNAFLYTYAGEGTGATGKVLKFTFQPNPRFEPPDFELQPLTAMSGELWIDPAQERVTRLEGHLQRDIDFGWGLLGRLYKGGWITIEQADVGNHLWRVVRFQMVMTGRIVFRTKVFDTTEIESRFEPVPVTLGYQQGIQLLQQPSATASTH